MLTHVVLAGDLHFGFPSSLVALSRLGSLICPTIYSYLGEISGILHFPRVLGLNEATNNHII